MSKFDNKNGSDLIVEMLSRHEIKYIAINPGSTIGGLQDSLVNSSTPNKAEILLCCHEEITAAIAHGYAKATGRPMAIAVHANVGLMHASMAIFNAWCDRVPMLVIGGSGPIDAEKRRPWIDWLHASSIQASIVSDYVKWSDKPLSHHALIESMNRCFKVSNSKPAAPVYLDISSTLQYDDVDFNKFNFEIKKFKPSRSPAPIVEDIDYIFKSIVESDFPIIIVDYFGGNNAEIQKLIELVELFGIGVIDKCGRYNFPSDHKLNMSCLEDVILSKSDLVIALEVQDLYGALGFYDNEKKEYVSYISDNIKIIDVNMNDFLVGSWAADYQKLYPVDLKVSADSYRLIDSLLSKYLINKGVLKKSLINNRLLYLGEKHNYYRLRWSDENTVNKDDVLSVPSAVKAIWDSVKHTDLVLTNCGGLIVRSWVKKLWSFDNKNKFFVGVNSGGAGLGYGMGASIGSALAYKDDDLLCINIQNDGDFLYTPNALWTLAHYKVPLLIILMNNRSYGLTKAISNRNALSRGRGIDNISIGNDFIDPEIDYSSMSESYGVRSFGKVSTKCQLQKAIEDAIHYILSNKKPALIDISLID